MPTFQMQLTIKVIINLNTEDYEGDLTITEMIDEEIMALRDESISPSEFIEMAELVDYEGKEYSG